jgi:hypothetical protein
MTKVNVFLGFYIFYEFFTYLCLAQKSHAKKNSNFANPIWHGEKKPLLFTSNPILLQSM